MTAEKEASAPEDAPLTVLLVHNFYQHPGGEDRVFEVEGEMLEQRGHRVLRYTLRNEEVDEMNRVALAARTVWSRDAYREVLEIVEREGVDVVHVHNTLPLASPSVYHAAQDGGAAVVQTLHNFRFICPGALLLRDGELCHDCVGKSVATPAIQHKCYRGSTAATAAVVATTAIHKAAGTYASKVDRYIALSDFARGLFIEGGLPADQIAVKPNALQDDPVQGPGGEYALFAGRLGKGKGIQVLLDAWSMDPDLPHLKIAGDGELSHLVTEAASGDPRIEWLGWCNGDEMAQLMREAAVLVTPSMWYEGWPLVAIEAMGLGTPVVATNHGVFPEMIIDGVTGSLVPRGDAGALGQAVRRLLSDPEMLKEIRHATWELYRERFTREINYLQLRRIYADAIARRNGEPTPLPSPEAARPLFVPAAGHARSSPPVPVDW
ncbi:hypothetical protein BSZ36_10365 [Rubricoccus marinus]|uniref:Glycosyl transferase family 1 n=1 Tax=Rubricoccus marinus TaxID=716817 RepID=A0A259U0H6_9BACT|nr:hypothetical protein BSZ36_10365 [Rubricoccus marinus]